MWQVAELFLPPPRRHRQRLRCSSVSHPGYEGFIMSHACSSDLKDCADFPWPSLPARRWCAYLDQATSRSSQCHCPVVQANLSLAAFHVQGTQLACVCFCSSPGQEGEAVGARELACLQRDPGMGLLAWQGQSPSGEGARGTWQQTPVPALNTPGILSVRLVIVVA